MADDPMPVSAVSPFLQRLNDEYADYECSSWFLDMLRGRVPRSHHQNQPVDGPLLPSTVRIVDRSTSTPKTSIFDASKGMDVNPDFVKILCEESTEARIRQVVLSYSRIQDLNFAWVETLGSALNLDPLFFMTHFERSRAKNQNPWRDRAPSLLPLESKYLRFPYSWENHVTLMKTSHEGFRGTIVIMLLEVPSGVGIDSYHSGTAFLRAIPNSNTYTNTPTESFAPIDCIAPLLQAAAIAYTEEVEASNEYLFVQDSMTTDLLTLLWDSNRRISHVIDELLKKMEIALGTAEWSEGCSAQTKRLHREYIALLQSSKLLSQNIQGSLQHKNSVQSILEAQKSVQQADSVRRLTLVAFVFIPLNFATSFFGMNLEQLGTGRIHIGFFFLTAILAGGLGILLSTGLKPLERSITQTRQETARKNGLELELVNKRDVLRYSRVGHRIIDAMTVRDNDGNMIYEDDDWKFHTALLRWCSFNVRKLWEAIKGSKENPRNNNDKP